MKTENTTSNFTKEENNRQYDTVNQMLTMHALLRDKYYSRAFWLNTIQIGVSLTLCCFAFVGDNQFLSIGLQPPIFRIFLGLLAIAILLLSITEYRVDWKHKVSEHASAVRHLAGLKAMYRKAYISHMGSDVDANFRLTDHYERTMTLLPPVPEKFFNQLKAVHQFKGLLSRRLSQNPKAPEWFIRIQLRLEGIYMALKGRHSQYANKDS